MTAHKVIVTNVSGLRAKYGRAYSRVRTAVNQLIAADRRRDIRTQVMAIDSPGAMRRVRGRAVAGVNDQRGAKAAIDAIYTHYHPDYILILGAPDIVPHIDLANPMTGTRDDEDEDLVVPSDVPYACAAPWSENPSDFVGPTRVIGRLPDLTGAQEPGYLVTLLRLAARHATRPRVDYAGHFSVSAKVWAKSTAESTENLFGPRARVFTSPPRGPAWTRRELAPRLHFINCHGDTVSPLFFGEFPEGRFSDAHDAARLPSRVSEGTVVAAECCYGAELYEPARADGRAGIANTYLGEGAYGFFGSTTIAYGPSEGQGQADLICQYFLEAIRRGASLGRATLEARQRFVAQYSHVDPADLKTAVQFLLLGDPSVHPVSSTPHAFSRTAVVRRARKNGALHPAARSFRRERLARVGSNLSRTLGAPVPSERRIPPGVRQFLLRAARAAGIDNPRFNSHEVRFPLAGHAAPDAQLRRREGTRFIHVARGTHARGTSTGPAMTAIIATVEDGRIIHCRRVHSRGGLKHGPAQARAPRSG